jgi:hypothetical protein
MPVISGLTEHRDQALRLAKRIGAHKVCAVRKQANGMQQLCNLGRGIAVAKDGQSERGLGDEDIASDQFEWRAGRIRDILVVAGCDDAQTVCLDTHLR